MADSSTSFFRQNEPVAVNASTMIESPSDFGKRPEDQVAYWMAQDKVAAEKERDWIKSGRKIVDRYRDKRDPSLDVAANPLHRYNVLWSNVQTISPALYARTPKPDVDRRFKDQDDTGRLAAIIMERAIATSMDRCNFDDQMRSCVADLLLPGRGTMRVLYIPHYGDELPPEMQSDDTSGAPQVVSTEGDEGKQQVPPPQKPPLREVVFEEVCSKYVFWEDYREGPARKWEDVPWLRYRAFMTRAELIKRFRAKGKIIKLDSTPHNETGGTTTGDSEQVVSLFKKAEIWEIWDRTEERVIWLAPSSPELGFLDQIEDPLELQGFFPSPDPLLATTTNDTRIPVPDFVEYQDQAQELDNITARIDILLRALKVSGVYAGEEKPVLQQLVDAGTENKLIPVEDWGRFMTDKGGLPELIQWLPIQQIAEVLIQLYNARDRVKEVLYEITGMSDIMRGSTDPNETATAQQIKAQFGTMRLNERQRRVADFARDNIRLMANVIAGQFSPQTISAMTGYPQLQPVPQPPPGLQQMTIDPQSGQMVQNPQFQAFQQQIQPILQQNQQAQAEFDAACKLMQQDMPHGFRIDVEADSTIAPDEQAEKQSKIEFASTMLPLLQQLMPAVQAQPQFAPAAKETFMFIMRGFKVSRTLEETYEKMFDQMEHQPPAPPPGQGDPHAAAAQAAGDQAKAQVEAQGNQLQAQTEAQRTQAEAQTASQATQADAAVRLQTAQTQAQVQQQNNMANQALAAEKLKQEGVFRAADLQLKQQDQEMKAKALEMRELKTASAEAKALD